MNNQRGSSSGPEVFALLGVLFVGLKLAGIIDWSWWWVTSPFWGAFALIFIIAIGAGVFEAVKKKS